MSEITPAEWTAILLSLRVAVIATLVATPFGIALAWLLARRNFWGKAVLDAAMHLPLVLPPVVTGYLLLLAFGRRGLFGAFLADHLPGCRNSVRRHRRHRLSRFPADPGGEDDF